jgi:hypothetical protein
MADFCEHYEDSLNYEIKSVIQSENKNKTMTLRWIIVRIFAIRKSYKCFTRNGGASPRSGGEEGPALSRLVR